MTEDFCGYQISDEEPVEVPQARTLQGEKAKYQIINHILGTNRKRAYHDGDNWQICALAESTDGHYYLGTNQYFQQDNPIARPCAEKNALTVANQAETDFSLRRIHIMGGQNDPETDNIKPGHQNKKIKPCKSCQYCIHSFSPHRSNPEAEGAEILSYPLNDGTMQITPPVVMRHGTEVAASQIDHFRINKMLPYAESIKVRDETGKLKKQLMDAYQFMTSESQYQAIRNSKRTAELDELSDQIRDRQQKKQDGQSKGSYIKKSTIMTRLNNILMREMRDAYIEAVKGNYKVEKIEVAIVRDHKGNFRIGYSIDSGQLTAEERAKGLQSFSSRSPAILTAMDSFKIPEITDVMFTTFEIGKMQNLAEKWEKDLQEKGELSQEEVEIPIPLPDVQERIWKRRVRASHGDILDMFGKKADPLLGPNLYYFAPNGGNITIKKKVDEFITDNFNGKPFNIHIFSPSGLFRNPKHEQSPTKN